MIESAPERAHVLVMTLSADTVDDLAAELCRFGDLILQGKITTGVMGGPASGATYSYKVRPEQTHDVYFAEVAKWLEERRTAGAYTVQQPAAS